MDMTFEKINKFKKGNDNIINLKDIYGKEGEPQEHPVLNHIRQKRYVFSKFYVLGKIILWGVFPLSVDPRRTICSNSRAWLPYGRPCCCPNTSSLKTVYSSSFDASTTSRCCETSFNLKNRWCCLWLTASCTAFHMSVQLPVLSSI